MKNRKWIFLLILSSLVNSGLAQSSKELEELELLDAQDINLIQEESVDLNLSDLEEIDDLESLKNDVGEDLFPQKKDPVVKKKDEAFRVKDDVDFVVEEGSEIIQKKKISKSPEIKVFDVGQEEKDLLEVSRYLEGKIPDSEWEEISINNKDEKYVVQKGDWLWKISEKLFGSGFYYSKIWAMNPHITNPHIIEPGMILSFSSGASDEFPSVELGAFSEEEVTNVDQKLVDKLNPKMGIESFAEEATPPWLVERKKLINQGVYFQFASEETLDDLKAIGNRQLNSEYKKYEPPFTEIVIEEPSEEYDDTGFHKAAKVTYEVHDVQFLNTFVTTNVVHDLGKVKAKKDESIFIKVKEKIFVEFNKGTKVKPGDFFSIYTPMGKVSHDISDREGYRYNVSAHIKVIRQQNDIWECEVTDINGLVERGSRITVFTPKVRKVSETYNKRNVEAAIIGSYQDTAGGLAMGNIVYLDRGRADGVDIGNVFEVYSFKDNGTEKRITADPTYKIGELVVLSLSDDFATALVASSAQEIPLGSLSLTKTEEQVLRERELGESSRFEKISEIEKRSLEELDVELNLDDAGHDLLKQIDNLQLTEDELQELDRQEREKSIIHEHERDLKELERLEGEIIDAETSLNEARVDEDKYLEQQSLDAMEKGTGKQDPNAFESLDEIETEAGRKFMDQDLNEKENPYGLTEFDIEEIDELLNTDQ